MQTKVIQQLCYGLLIGVGFLSTFGHLTGVPIIKAIADATAASPLPLTFTLLKGAKVLGSEFTLQLESPKGKKYQHPIDPKLFSKVRGPYQRRSAFANAIILASEFGYETPSGRLASRALEYGICRLGPLHVEMGIPTAIRKAWVERRSLGNEKVWKHQIKCH